MKQIFLTNTLNFLYKYKEYSESEKESLMYGLEGLYLTFSKVIIIFLLAIILGIFIEVVAVMLTYGVLRFFGFGYHANTSLRCLIMSLTFLIVLPLIIFSIDFNFLSKIIICGICIIMYLLYAPMDTVKRPFYNKKKRIYRKCITLVIGMLYATTTFIIKDQFIVATILNALILQAVVVCPITYIVMGDSYNNYKSLKEET